MTAAFIVAAVLAQASLTAEGPALMEQAITRVIDDYGDLTYVLGLCSSVYPTGPRDPYVVRAREKIAAVPVEDFQFTMRRIDAVSTAQGIEDAPEAHFTARRCADLLKDKAEAVRQSVEGLDDLVHRLARQ